MAMDSQDQPVLNADNGHAAEAMPSLPRVSKRKWGYDPVQVDEFLEQAHACYEQPGIQLTLGDIQNVSFDLVKGGYRIDKVDQTLSRLEKAVTDKQTDVEVTTNGRVAWKAQTENLYRRLLAHAERADGQRFAPGEQRMPSYDRKQVDSLIDSIMDTAELELQEEGGHGSITADPAADGQRISAATVANTVFTQRKGKKGYNERQVDYYLSFCEELLGRLESYARLYGSASGMNAAETGAPVVSDDPNSLFANAVVPPVSAEPDTPTIVEPMAPVAPALSDQSSFDALQKAEQAIFTPSTVADTAIAGAAGAAVAGGASATSVLPGVSAATNVSASPSEGEVTQVINLNDAAGNDTDDVPPSFSPAPATTASAPRRPVAPFGTDYASDSPAPVLTGVSESMTVSPIQPITPAPHTDLSATSSSSSSNARHGAHAAHSSFNDALDSSTNDQQGTFAVDAFDLGASNAAATAALANNNSAELPAVTSADSETAAFQLPTIPSLKRAQGDDVQLTTTTDDIDSSVSAHAGSSTQSTPHSSTMFPDVDEFRVPSLDLGIPDLSFPTFDDAGNDTSANGKQGQ
ncbi:putative DivIVA domain repeat protein [Bifidobacterium gallicum]|uniref:DivIVA domain repeat protein n=1 Tax=Bifidobacterium gallicum DSM 20093 = LMG 11596 TaxID=561180 RepID=D1NSP9_9BIFI|nr:putative DivIVA domain repeat protein [Bifidobacterium gallicum]EFA23701.1 DivIVA domain repeat protein [Bifidobacterium gallicum DSM 20093 = LMG 11596]KFI59276.1 putative DivIVA domain repeat protein [Bifidobacterium gallicum DSM 20093 = LMG 11596]